MIDAGRWPAEAHGRLRHDFPIAHMQAAGDKSAALGAQRVEKLRRFDLNAIAVDDFVDMEKFGESAPQIVPHAQGDRLNLDGALFRERQA